MPTGLQDYRPAMYGGIAAVELHAGEAAFGCRSMSIRSELERRIVLCYTGEPRNSGTNNWEITKRHIDGDQHIFDCFERIRDTAAAMREALTRGDWDATAACLATEWENRKRLAPGVTTPAIEALIARAMAAGAKAAKVCGAGGGGCLFCLVPPARCAGRARSAGRRRRAHARLPHRDHRPRRRRANDARRCPRRSTTSAVARTLLEIADLLELKGENPFKIRAYRNAADIVSPRGRSRVRPRRSGAARRGTASARTSPAAFARSRSPATAASARSC